MKYSVTFKERVGGDGEPTENAAGQLDAELADGLVLDAVFVERIEPESLHSSETMEEDDDFLSIVTEIWEYDVADGRDAEFLDAARNSSVVMEVTSLDEMMDTDTVNTSD